MKRVLPSSRKLTVCVMLVMVRTVTTYSVAIVKTRTLKAMLQYTGNLTTAIMKLTNTGSGPALDLQVKSGNAPASVNSDAGTATNLSADKLDGQDSTAFGFETKQNSGSSSSTYAENCDTPDTSNECAPVTVTVPDGKKYRVSVWSSFTARGDTDEQNVFFCSAMRRADQETPECITPNGWENALTLEVNKIRSESSSGETLALDPGTYTFSTVIKLAHEFAAAGRRDAVSTKVLIRDAAAPSPPID